MTIDYKNISVCCDGLEILKEVNFKAQKGAYSTLSMM